MDPVQFLKCISFFSLDRIIIYWNKLYDLRSLVGCLFGFVGPAVIEFVDPVSVNVQSGINESKNKEALLHLLLAKKKPDQYQYLGNCPPTPPLTQH